MAKELCDCGKVGIWYYAPASESNENHYDCDDCVPRGCECNHRYTDVNSYYPPLDSPDIPTEEDKPIKWIEEDKIWCRVDEQGREYPCCEFWYDEEGWDIEEN